MIQIFTMAGDNYSTPVEGRGRLPEYTIEEDSYRLQESIRVVGFRVKTGEEVIIPLENIAIIKHNNNKAKD